MKMIPTIHLLSLFLTFVFGLAVFEQSAHAQPSSHSGAKHSGAKYEGVGSCSSSQCHGSVAPRKTGNVLQNEYTTWKKHDPHARAWEILLEADSKRIAHHLGIAAPEKDPLCLQCHTTYTTKDKMGEAFHFEDGVGCESCHGPAEKWLAPHAASDATHEKNVDLGLTELGNTRAQAKLCATCHFGTDEKYVGHRLLASGHPRLSFELDTFQNIEPRHWSVDEDYVSRKKESYDPVEAWFTGQFTQALASLERLQSEKRSKEGVFPDFAIFDCANCHHSLNDEQWKKREYHGRPGSMRINLASLAMVREALSAVDKNGAAELGKQIDSLHSAYLNGESGSASSINKLRQTVQKQLRSWTKNSAEVLLRHFASYALTNPHLPYEVAEQIAMAFSVFASVIQPEKAIYKAELDGIYETLKNPRNFIPEDFAAAAETFRKKVQR